MQNTIQVILISFTSAVAFAQTASPPTGIQKIGVVTLTRAEGKIPVGGTLTEFTQDTAGDCAMQ